MSSSRTVMIRMWHGREFTDFCTFTGDMFIDVPEYDVFAEGVRGFDELLIDPEYDYARVRKCAFKDRPTGFFKFVDIEAEDFDMVKYALQYVKFKKNILDIFCECEKESVGTDKGMQKETGEINVVDDVGLDKGLEAVDVELEQEVEVENVVSANSKRKGKVKLVDEVDELDEEDEYDEDEDFEYDETLVEDDPFSDDGMEDVDFSDEDEEFFEVRKSKREQMHKLREDRIDKEKRFEEELQKDIQEHEGELHESEREKEAETEVENEHQTEEEDDVAVVDETRKTKIAADFINVDDEPDSDESYDSLNEDGQKIVRTKVYSSYMNPKDLKLELGLRFFDHQQCQDVIRMWAVANGYNIRWTKTAHEKLEAKYVEGCNWRMYVSKISGEPTCLSKL